MGQGECVVGCAGCLRKILQNTVLLLFKNFSELSKVKRASSIRSAHNSEEVLVGSKISNFLFLGRIRDS